MNKKRAIFFLLAVSLILISSLIIPVIAQSDDDQGFVEEIEERKDQLEEFSEEEDKTSYLATEWTKLIKERVPWIYRINPVFKFLFAHEFELSWAFLTAFLLWTIQFALYYPPIKLMLKGLFTPLAVSAVIAALTSQIIVPKSIELLSNIVENIWASAGLILGLLIIFFIVNIFSKHFTKLWKKRREQKRIEKLETDVSGAKGIREGMEETKSIAKGYRERRKNR